MNEKHLPQLYGASVAPEGLRKPVRKEKGHLASGEETISPSSGDTSELVHRVLLGDPELIEKSIRFMRICSEQANDGIPELRLFMIESKNFNAEEKSQQNECKTVSKN